jgi:glyoxylase-like metal-dependent hydrolase (beta-lactamase superfamily II)
MVETLFCNLDDKSMVYRSISKLFGVCTYFLVNKEKVLIIDPGKLSDEVYLWLEQFKKHKKIIYLTHEHFDHHFDVNKLLLMHNTYLHFFSENFKKAISNSKVNLSYYYNTPIETSSKLTKKFNFLEVIETPGHSKQSVCLLYKNLLFGGDTVIHKEYLVLKLPGSNKNDYRESIATIKTKTNQNTIVLPGHGNLFFFDFG